MFYLPLSLKHPPNFDHLSGSLFTITIVISNVSDHFSVRVGTNAHASLSLSFYPPHRLVFLLHCNGVSVCLCCLIVPSPRPRLVWRRWRHGLGKPLSLVDTLPIFARHPVFCPSIYLASLPFGQLTTSRFFSIF